MDIDFVITWVDMDDANGRLTSPNTPATKAIRRTECLKPVSATTVS